MQLDGERESDNVEDRRGISGGVMAGGGGLVALVIGLVVYFITGQPPAQLTDQGGGGTALQRTGVVPDKATEDRMTQFVRKVLASTEDVWEEQFKRRGMTYRRPTLVLFAGQVDSACGRATASSGPFYCPGDQKLYIDLAFYRELETRFKAPGDFAQAYVIAHEVGHHVQRLLGTMDKVDRRGGSKSEANALSVRLELQADFYAGVWAHHAQKTKKILEPGDLEEGFRAAQAVGDDTIQKRAQGYVVPESFTHGTAKQRMAWFKKGFQTGDMSVGDTFSLPDPN